MRLQFPEGSAQLFLNAIDFVEKIAPVHLQFPAAQVPVRAQKEMVFENPVFVLRESAPADQDKVRHILFVLESPD